MSKTMKKMGAKLALKFGGTGYTGLQTKAISSRAGKLTQVSVGGGYSVKAKMCVNWNVSCGSEVSVSGSASLPNHISAGTKNVAGAMWVPFNVVDIRVSGYYASN